VSQRFRTARKRRGNPNWGKKIELAVPAEPTEYERMLAEFNLAGADEETIARSTRARVWVKTHCRRRYIPESLLELMGLEVDFGDV